MSLTNWSSSLGETKSVACRSFLRQWFVQLTDRLRHLADEMIQVEVVRERDQEIYYVSRRA